MDADQRRVDGTAGGDAPMIRLMIGAILMWVVMAMIGARIIDGRTSGK